MECVCSDEREWRARTEARGASLSGTDQAHKPRSWEEMQAILSRSVLLQPVLSSASSGSPWKGLHLALQVQWMLAMEQKSPPREIQGGGHFQQSPQKLCGERSIPILVFYFWFVIIFICSFF